MELFFDKAETRRLAVPAQTLCSREDSRLSKLSDPTPPPPLLDHHAPVTPTCRGLIPCPFVSNPPLNVTHLTPAPRPFTCPSDVSDLLMAAASMRRFPCASVLLTRSDPARSHSVSVPSDVAPDARSRPSTVIMNTRCDRELQGEGRVIEHSSNAELNG